MCALFWRWCLAQPHCLNSSDGKHWHNWLWECRKSRLLVGIQGRWVVGLWASQAVGDSLRWMPAFNHFAGWGQNAGAGPVNKLSDSCMYCIYCLNSGQKTSRLPRVCLEGQINKVCDLFFWTVETQYLFSCVLLLLEKQVKLSGEGSVCHGVVLFCHVGGWFLGDVLSRRARWT